MEIFRFDRHSWFSHALCWMWMCVVGMTITAGRSSAQVKTFSVDVDSGYSKTSVNAAIFRQNALTTFRDTQFIAFYAPDGRVVLGKRKIGGGRFIKSKFQLETTPFGFKKGNDAHNVISIAVDGDGYLHVAFDHHNSRLNYYRSEVPCGLTIKKMPMLPSAGQPSNTKKPDQSEFFVTYPEFYNFRNGDLLFVYRNINNIIMNYYSVKDKSWRRLCDGVFENSINLRPYWQIAVDGDDVIHISWLWRDYAGDVSSNHGIYYVKSTDYGKSWRGISGTTIKTPITRAAVKPVADIKTNSNLINQTSMVTDANGWPYIATYYRKDKMTNYHLIYFDGHEFKDVVLGDRKIDFTLSGLGTLSIPISRPRLLTDGKNIYYFVRDGEMGTKLGMYYASLVGKNALVFDYQNITQDSICASEPLVDNILWAKKHRIHLFVQKTFQKNNEGVIESKPTMVRVIEVKAKR